MLVLPCNSDRRHDENVSQVIRQFYSKAESWEQLTRFSYARAQEEGVTRNYESALNLLHEADNYGKMTKGWETSSEHAQVKNQNNEIQTNFHSRKETNPLEATNISERMLGKKKGSCTQATGLRCSSS